MAHMNRTLLLALLSRCRHIILEEVASGVNGAPDNSSAIPDAMLSPLPTASPPPAVSNPRNSYDNAYFYILFVMFFYSFLSLTIFKKFIHSDKAKKDPYEEFMSAGPPSAPKFNAGPAAVKFYFEEESSL